MSETNLPEYQVVASELTSAGLAVTPAEMHGLITGMLAGGLGLQDSSWKGALYDYTNDGMGWPVTASSLAQTSFDITVKELTGTELELQVLLPGEDDIFVLADAVSEWVNHFISGLGLIGAKLDSASESAKEALGDLEEIAKLGIDEDDDLEEQADLLEQVIEHIKACVLTIHAEFGAKPSTEETPTIH